MIRLTVFVHNLTAQFEELSTNTQHIFRRIQMETLKITLDSSANEILVRDARISNRGRANASSRTPHQGFRIVRSL